MHDRLEEFMPALRELCDRVEPDEYLKFTWVPKPQGVRLGTERGRVDYTPELKANPTSVILGMAAAHEFTAGCYGTLSGERLKRGTGEYLADRVTGEVYLPGIHRDDDDDDGDGVFAVDFGAMARGAAGFFRDMRAAWAEISPTVAAAMQAEQQAAQRRAQEYEAAAQQTPPAQPASEPEAGAPQAEGDSDNGETAAS